jgi:hypothetical protein
MAGRLSKGGVSKLLPREAPKHHAKTPGHRLDDSLESRWLAFSLHGEAEVED